MAATARARAVVGAFPDAGAPRGGSMAGHVRLGLAGFVAFLLAGNGGILAFSTWARHTTRVPSLLSPVGVGNFRVVDDWLWRGAAPTREGYRWLASRGVRTVVDLRAEDGLHRDADLLSDLGLRLVSIPVRDGQAPRQAQVARFLDAVRTSSGRVFVHCGAGVGRTGTMVASYLVASGQGDGWMAARRNLAVGPPSLEQIVFAAGLDGDDSRRPGALVVALSRTLDAPRRLWVRLRS